VDPNSATTGRWGFELWRETSTISCKALALTADGVGKVGVRCCLLWPRRCLWAYLSLPSYPHTCESHHRPLRSLMSHPNPTTSSSPNFQLIFNNALEAYKKRTKNDLLAHPLVVQLQNCTSSSAVLALIHQQVQGLERDDDKLTKWLDPTVRVLHAFSEILGEGVSLVCLRK
jgi:hypothetical protein